MIYATKLFIGGAVCGSIGIFVMAGWAVYPLPLGIPSVVEDEVIVKFKATAPAAAISAAHAKFPLKARRGQALGVEVVKLTTKKSLAELQAIVAQYKKDPNVEYAEVNGILSIQQAVYKVPPLVLIDPGTILEPPIFLCPGSDDPYYANLWGIKKIRAHCAWDTNLGAGNIKVAVVDTGVDYLHEDLAGTVIRGYDFVNVDTNPMDDNGHGTHVAGTIAATINNNRGVVGVAPNVKILAVKVCGGLGTCSWSIVASGIVYAADHGARVINLSLGGDMSSETLKNAVDYAWSKGVLLACAAGNYGPGASAYPAAYQRCLAVAATDQNDQRASFSSYAPDGVAAPGVSILSSIPNNQYTELDGTSMATPHVAGLAGLLFSQNPNRTNARVREILETTTDDIGDTGKDSIFGFGRINAQRAVRKCASSSCP